MSGNAITFERMSLLPSKVTTVSTSGPLGYATGKAAAWYNTSGYVTGKRDGSTLQQRAEEPVPVSLSPETVEQADLARRFRDLMLPHLDAAYNLARYLLRDPVAAEDVAQDAFLRAFRAFEGYRGGDPKAWILAIVRNCCHTWATAVASDRTVPLDRIATEQADDPGKTSDHATGLVDPTDSPETTVLRQDEIATMRELIETLPLPFRETLVLRELEELSYQEIAETTGTPIGTVMSRLARARHLLAEAWRRRTADGEETRS
ncbi:sigma-70 family RNA polymerase sigma factor [Microvirga lotononidis]|uniref:RNA polymerase sigma factor n=1 Tax=Microvirga lotononidis TaxID=864069 RepID=I4YKK2_9HYPH|nr:sigma-70 family RNA polymerase sigma factor [Microvirga lotononidis]EIM24494.1 RNA polymerase sigma factor, sigma-70 family [Microvirga lotononidis]WQO26519.1 sigma-70 family RNA polymerase sigma factor [Microvirga lotononidis]